MHFDEIWTPPWQQDKLAELAKTIKHLPGEVIEIGTHQGLSAIPIANAISPANLHVVDHWRGSPDIPKEISDRNNFGQFLINIMEGTQGNVCIHHQDWRSFAENWDKQIRFLYLDAAHTTKEVTDQILAFKNHIVSGGILAGDDYGWPEVQLAVRRLFPFDEIHVEKDKLWWVQ
jgi:predicted O-methyltransferase YrrM